MLMEISIQVKMESLFMSTEFPEKPQIMASAAQLRCSRQIHDYFSGSTFHQNSLPVFTP